MYLVYTLEGLGECNEVANFVTSDFSKAKSWVKRFNKISKKRKSTFSKKEEPWGMFMYDYFSFYEPICICQR